MQISNCLTCQPVEGMPNPIRQLLTGGTNVTADTKGSFLALLKAAGIELPAGLTEVASEGAGYPGLRDFDWTRILNGQAITASQPEELEPKGEDSSGLLLMNDPALLNAVLSLNSQLPNQGQSNPAPVVGTTEQTGSVQANPVTPPTTTPQISGVILGMAEGVQPVEPVPSQSVTNPAKMVTGEAASPTAADQTVETKSQNELLPLSQSSSNQPATATVTAQTVPAGISWKTSQRLANEDGSTADPGLAQALAEEQTVDRQTLNMKKAEVPAMGQPALKELLKPEAPAMARATPPETTPANQVVTTAEPKPVEKAQVFSPPLEEMAQPQSDSMDAADLTISFNRVGTNLPADSLAKDVADTPAAAAEAQVLPETEDIFQQIVSHSRLKLNEGQSEIHFHLKPEFLGEMKIAVLVERGLVSASITAENHQVRQLIEANMPQLKQSLEDQGLRFDRLDVSLGGNFSFSSQSNQADRQAAGDWPKWSGAYGAYEEPDADPDSGRRYWQREGGAIDFLV